jgi:hypothetical protein
MDRYFASIQSSDYLCQSRAPAFPVDNGLRALGCASAPPGTIPTGKERHQVALTGIDASKKDTDWTADEVAVLVGSYFLMLAEERACRDYSKSELLRQAPPRQATVTLRRAAQTTRQPSVHPYMASLRPSEPSFPQENEREGCFGFH